MSEAGQAEAGWSHPVVRCRGLAGPGLRGGRPGLVTVLGQQVGGRGAVLRGAVGLAGVARLLAGQGEALGGAGVDQLVVAVVAEHHLLHRVVLEGPGPGLDVPGGGHGVVVMRLLLSSSKAGAHQLLGWGITRACLVMVVADLVEAVGVRGGSTRWSLDSGAPVHRDDCSGSGSGSAIELRPLDCLETNTCTAHRHKSRPRSQRLSSLEP